MKRAYKYSAIFFIVWSWGIAGTMQPACAFDLSKAKASFLSGDYKAAITEGERILSESEEVPQLDELYYLLGLSYFKDGNVLRATDIFEIIMDEFKASALRADAALALGDAYYALQKFDKAKKIYQEQVKEQTGDKLSPLVYARLSQCALVAGDTQEAKKYSAMLHEKFPLYSAPEGPDALPGGPFTGYCVQVGVFSKKINADRLVAKLIAKEYSAYINAAVSSQAASYRVRVGNFVQRKDAQEALRKLSAEGYLARIIP